MKKSDKFENAYIAIVAIIIAIVIAILGLNLYSSMKRTESNITLEELAEHSANDIESASSSIGNNVEESADSLSQENILNNITNDVQTSTENTENNTDITNNNETSDNSNSDEQTSSTNAQSEEVLEDLENVENISNEDSKTHETSNTSIEQNKQITFVKPVEGEIMKEFAKDNLVYSDTLLEWTTHMGIDIKAEKTTVVKSACEGTVKSIKNDPRYGLTVIIEHKDGYQTVYSNLLSSEFVVEGESVSQGQSIGTVGNTATFEIADASHLHFELMRNGVYLDPTIYIK